MTRANGAGTMGGMWTRARWSVLLPAMFFTLCVVPAAAAPKAEPWSLWEANDSGRRASIDHAPWNRFLKEVRRYETPFRHPPGPVRFRDGGGPGRSWTTISCNSRGWR